MTTSVKAEQQQPALQSLVSAGGEHVRSVSEADQAALSLAHHHPQQQMLEKELDNNDGGKAGDGDGEDGEAGSDEGNGDDGDESKRCVVVHTSNTHTHTHTSHLTRGCFGTFTPSPHKRRGHPHTQEARRRLGDGGIEKNGELFIFDIFFSFLAKRFLSWKIKKDVCVFLSYRT